MSELRRVQGDKFLSLLHEHIGLDGGYLAVDLVVDGQEQTAWLRIPIDRDEEAKLRARLREAPTRRDEALVVLDGRDGVTAEEQLALFEATDGFGSRGRWSYERVTDLWAVETAAAMERLFRFRYR